MRGIRYLYGYRGGECGLEFKDHANSLFLRVRPTMERYRMVGVIPAISYVETGLDVPLLLPFIPDRDSVVNKIMACTNRFGRAMPSPDVELDLFLAFARAVVVSEFSPLCPDEVLTFKQWLDGTSYCMSRKLYLTRLRKQAECIGKEVFKTKSFLK